MRLFIAGKAKQEAKSEFQEKRREFMGTQKESNFNPWLIVLGCVGCSAMLITILCNTAGMFLTPVMEEFGWSRTQASLYLTIYSWKDL